jgi:hypothetical protein
LIHIAWFLPAGGQMTTAEFASLVADVANQIAGPAIGSWAPDGIALLCVNGIYMLGQVSSDRDGEPQ